MSSILWNLTTLGFWSDNFQRLPEASKSSQRKTFRLLVLGISFMASETFDATTIVISEISSTPLTLGDCREIN
jgi:hypothetical protein